MLTIQIIDGIAFVLADTGNQRRRISAETLQGLLYEHLNKQDIVFDEKYREAVFDKFLPEYEALCLRTNCHLMACATSEGKLALGVAPNLEITTQ